MTKNRMNRWLDSDLVGIPATLYTFGVLAVSLAVFRFGGPIAGIIVAVALWIPMVVFAIRGAGRAPAPLDIQVADEPGRHRVLVVANQGLDDPALCAEVCRRTDHATTEALVLAPVFTRSRFGAIADDVDEEDLRPAERRVARLKVTESRRQVTWMSPSHCRRRSTASASSGQRGRPAPRR
jgi:hypothetical protein